MESGNVKASERGGGRTSLRPSRWRRTRIALIEPFEGDDLQSLEPVHEHDDGEGAGIWTRRLVLFLRAMAVLSMVKGLYHWSRVCGIGVADHELYALQPLSWQTATVFFAVIDLVAAVGLWLAAAWGAVIWVTAIASMVAVEIFFPRIYGGGFIAVVLEGGLLALYLWLALKSAKEQPE